MPRKQKAETALYSQALKLFATLGYKAWRENSGKRGGVRFGFKGKPDIGGYHKETGQALFAECKDAGKRLTQEQYDFLKEADAACRCFVVTPGAAYQFGVIPDALKPKGSK
jgi:predicted porin